MKDISSLAIIDLHIHLDGSLSTNSILDIASHDNVELPTYDKEELEHLLKVDESCVDLNEYLKRFDIPTLILQTKYALEISIKDLLSRMYKEGIKYTEIRMAPQLSTLKGLTQEEVVDTLVNAIKDIEKEYDITANIILCMMRGNNHKANFETIEVGYKYKDNKVVAIDLAGAEALYPNSLFEEEFKRVNELGLNLIIHAGEASGPSSVLSALEYGAKRVGHGVRMLEDLENISKAKDMYFEVCPKSNMDTKIYPSYLGAPIRKLKEHGIKVTINSDNITVSSTSVKNEYFNLYNAGYSYEELKECTLNSIEGAFMSNDIKDKLRNYIKSF